MSWSKPWLQKFHPNFFLSYIITTVHFLWAAVNGLYGDEEWFSLPFLEYVNLVPHELWGIAYLLVGVTMLLGLFRSSFKLARLGLAGGLFLESARFILILSSVWQTNQSANTLANLLVVVGVLVSQLLEPPVNPSSTR